MSMCWNENPENRPTFDDLKDMLYKVIGDEEMAQVFMETVKFNLVSMLSENVVVVNVHEKQF